MYILENVSLTAYTTMRLGGVAAFVTDITDKQEIPKALAWAAERNLPVLMIGGGSNIIWKDEGFAGLLLVNKISRYEMFEEDNTNVYITLGAGENWDECVRRSVEAGLSGIETLSLIPGTAGATPIQNVGAYGREIAEVLVTIEAYDTATQKFVTIPTSDCAFGYRTSRFKTADKGRFYISAITLHLTREHPSPPYYQALQEYFAQHNQTDISLQTVRDAVIAIRQAKLPDPSVIANNGSFFHNPIITTDQFIQLSSVHADIPHWASGDQVKLSAAWLVEQAGFKDTHDGDTGMATWAHQPLVLVNEHAEKTAQLLAFKQKIVAAVQTKFGISLQQEPELLP